MSQPTNGSWNDGQQGQGNSLGQDWGGQSNQGGSLGQDYNQPTQASQTYDSYGQQGQQGGYDQSQQGQQDYGQQSQHGGYDQGQQNYDQNQGQQYGAPAQQSQGGGFQAFNASAQAQGVGDLFSDLKFKKSLTEGIAQLAYLGVVVWAVLKFLANTIHNFGSQDLGGNVEVKNMGTFDAIMHLFADLVWLVVVVSVARIILELAINVAKIARRNND